MIFPDNKKAAAMILARIKPEGDISSGGPKKPETHTNPNEETLRVIAEDIMQAFHERSSSGLMGGLKAFMAQSSLKGPESED